MTGLLSLRDIRIRDPYILEPEPGSFLLYGTTDANVWGGPATGFDYYTSTDLDQWSGPFPAFRPPAGFWADSQFWAPEVHRYRDRWFLIATFAATRTRVRGVAILVSDAPHGPFVPWSDGPATPPELPCLDGTLYVDEEQDPWLVYSRGAEGGPDGRPCVADGEMFALRLSDDLRSPVGEPALLFTASSAPWSKPLRFPDGVEPPAGLNLAKDPLFTDGPFLVRTGNGTLSMLWSSFGDSGYAIGVARSDSGSVLGPWVQQRDPLWPLNGGHGMVFTRASGDARLVFHWPNDSPDERVKLVRVHVGADGITLIGTEPPL